MKREAFAVQIELIRVLFFASYVISTAFEPKTQYLHCLILNLQITVRAFNKIQQI